MIHELKVHPDVWMDLWNEVKTWEFRKNDRNFQLGDGLVLKLIDNDTGFFKTGPCHVIHKRVTYILYGPAFGIPEGYCIMSII